MPCPLSLAATPQIPRRDVDKRRSEAAALLKAMPIETRKKDRIDDRVRVDLVQLVTAIMFSWHLRERARVLT
jgi:hypothetical protein